MAQGDLLLFEEFSEYIGDGSHALGTDQITCALLSDEIGTGINAGDTTPDFADYNEVATGNGYTTPGENITCTYAAVAGTASLTVTSGATSWTQNGSGPTNIKTALVYNSGSASTNDGIAFIDMTTNGTTPISLVDGDITITWEPDIFTLS